jgi:chorismate mutase
VNVQHDPVVQRCRAEITETDEAIVAAINRRVGLVAALHAHKRGQGYPMVDPGREALLIEHLRRSNGGPISGDGLERVYRLLLEVCTAEAAQMGTPAS